MKYGLVVHDLSLTGAPKIGIDVAEKLFQLGYDIMLICRRGGDFLPRVEAIGLPFEVLEVEESLPFEQKVDAASAYLSRQKFDHLYINSAASADFLKAAQLANIPTVFHVHEMIGELRSLQLANRLTPDVLSPQCCLIAASRSVKQSAICYFGPLAERAVVLPYPIDASAIRAKAAMPQALPLNRIGEPLDLTRPVVAACGIACYRKGTDIFMALAEVMPQLQFLWIGLWTHDLNPCLSAGGDLPPNLYLSGQTSNACYYLSLAQLFLLTSREDPDPFVVHEAIALKKPVIAFSQTGGSRWSVDQFGYLLEGEVSVEGFRAVINKFCLDGSTAYFPASDDLVERRYSFDTEFSKIETLIHAATARIDPSVAR